MPYEMNYVDLIRQAIIDGDGDAAVSETRAAVEAGVDPLVVLNEGLTEGAEIVGQYFEEGAFFLPPLMLIGRVMKASMEVIVPLIKEQHPGMLGASSGVVVMATVQSDVHDIGKNLVASMLSAGGFMVHDLGVDVPLDIIIDKAIEVNADIIGCSALLTTSMPYLRDLLGVLEARGKRGRFQVMVGGAPMTPEFAQEIGADGTAPDAVGAVRLAKRLIAGRGERNQGETR